MDITDKHQLQSSARMMKFELWNMNYPFTKYNIP